MSTRPLLQRWGYDALRVFSRLVGVTFFSLRCYHRNRVPKQGAVLVCANHQGYFDPLIIGLTIDRRMNYLARKTLFIFPPLRWLIEFLDAIPLERDGLGVGGLKECLRRLRRGEMVLIFPEGTRTWDGQIGKLQPGFTLLARRGHVSLLPVGFDGAFDAWPRTRLYPRPARVRVCVGEPLTPEQIAALDDEQLVATVEQRLRELRSEARRKRGLRDVPAETDEARF